MRRAAAAVFVAVAGCSSLPAGSAGGPDVPPYAQLAAAHNERVGGLGDVAARGVIELRWTDDEGRHFEQGELDLWMTLPRRTAIFVSKLGERFIWIGADGTRAWFFDFRGGETVLSVSDADRAEGGAMGDVPMLPSTVVALAGLRALPETSGAEVEYDAARDAFILTDPDATRPLRLFLDRATGLPVRAEIRLDAAMLASDITLDRYERVRTRGRPPLAWPLFPTLIDLSGDADELRVKLSVRSPSDEDVRPDYFDLDWLTDRFAPVRVEVLE